jgi:CHRD domain
VETRPIRMLFRSAVAAAMLSVASIAQSAVIVTGGTLSGPAEFPANASPGTGTAVVTIDPVAHQLGVAVTFFGLLGTTTASHIHATTAVPFAGTAGVATQTPTFSGFPLGVTSGTYSMTFDTSLASTYNPAFVTLNGGSVAASEAALFSAIQSGQAYLNIHTTAFPSGEIRAFLVAVPEMGTWAMMLVGFGAIGFVMRRHPASAATV